METKKYCAYNLSRENHLSTKLTVANSAHQPLKVLKVMIGGLALDAESGLWLKPILGVPDVPRLFPFDLVYLDVDNRVIRGVELFPGVAFPPLSGQVTSALVLPIQTLALTHTSAGDHLAICYEDELERLLESINKPAAAVLVAHDQAATLSQQNQTQVAAKVQNGTQSALHLFSSPIAQSRRAEASRSFDISDLFPVAPAAQRSGSVMKDFHENSTATAPDPIPIAQSLEHRAETAVLEPPMTATGDAEALDVPQAVPASSDPVPASVSFSDKGHSEPENLGIVEKTSTNGRVPVTANPPRPPPNSLFVKRVESLVVEAMNARSVPVASIAATEPIQPVVERLDVSPDQVVRSVEPSGAEREQLSTQGPAVFEQVAQIAELKNEKVPLSTAPDPIIESATPENTAHAVEMLQPPTASLSIAPELMTQSSEPIIDEPQLAGTPMLEPAAGVPDAVTNVSPEMKQASAPPSSEPIAENAASVIEESEQPTPPASAAADSAAKSTSPLPANQTSPIASIPKAPYVVMNGMGSTVSQYRGWQVSTSTFPHSVPASSKPAVEVAPQKPSEEAPAAATPVVSSPVQAENKMPIRLSEEERASLAREAALADARLKKEMALQRLSSQPAPKGSSGESVMKMKDLQSAQNSRQANQPPAAQKLDAEQPQMDETHSNESKDKDTLTGRLMRWFDPEVAPHDRRRANRRNVPGLVAYYFSGGAPKGHEISDISATGFYMITKDRWMPETMIQMTLQKPGTNGKLRRDSVTILSKIIRVGDNGVGAQFVVAEDLDPYSREVLPMQATDKKALAKFI